MPQHPTLDQLGAGVNLSGVVGSPIAFTFNFAITNGDWDDFADFTVEVFDAGGLNTAAEPTVNDTVEPLVVVAWSAAQTAALGKGSRTFQLSATVGGIGPIPIVAGTFRLWPVGTPGTSGEDEQTVAVDLGDITVSVAVTIGGTASTSLDDLSDVVITAAASGDIIRHNGTAWVDTPGTTHFDAAGSAAAAQAAAATDATTKVAAEAVLRVAGDAASVATAAADATTKANAAQAAAIAASQPVDSDLTAIAALATTSFGRSVLEAANAAALRTLAGVVIGTDVQAFSAVLAATTASFLTADETKLDGIATGATANDTDANLRARASHTGTQAAATISDFATAADARIAAAAGVSVASLSGGKIPQAQLPLVAIIEIFEVDDEAEQLVLGAGVQQGDVATRLDESKTYMHNGGTTGTMADWSVLLTPVASVNGEIGAVTLTSDDISDTGQTQKFTTAAEITKLAGIATGATANATDAQLRDRSTHTGTQLAATVSDFDTAADARVNTTAPLIKLDDFAAPDDNTDLDATTLAHGLLPKLSGTDTQYLDGDGAFSTPLLSELADVDMTGIADGDVPVWDNGLQQFVPGAGGSGIGNVSEDTSPTLGGDLDAGGFVVTNLDQFTLNAHDLGTQAAAVAVDVSTFAAQEVILSGNAVITVSGEAAGTHRQVLLKITQDGTGGRTPTWSGVDLWFGGAAPVIDTTAGAVTLVSLIGWGTVVIGVTGITDATLAATYVTKALFDANSILIATSDNTPLALTVAASRHVGRKASGDIDDLTGAESAAILAGEVFKQAQEINAQTGTTYTLVAGDGGKLVTLSNASAITLTLPQDSDATIAIGTYVDLMQLGAGQVTVVAGTGATLRVSGLTAKARAQYSSLGVQKFLANTWRLFGDLAAS